MKLPKPLFPEPSGKSSRKPRRKTKGSHVTDIYNVLFDEFSHESRDDDGVERAERPATEGEPFDARWEFARQAAMPGAIVSSNVEGVREQCERLGIEFHSADDPWEEEADLDLAAPDGHLNGEEKTSC